MTIDFNDAGTQDDDLGLVKLGGKHFAFFPPGDPFAEEIVSVTELLKFAANNEPAFRLHLKRLRWH